MSILVKENLLLINEDASNELQYAYNSAMIAFHKTMDDQNIKSIKYTLHYTYKKGSNEIGEELLKIFLIKKKSNVYFSFIT